MIQKNAPKSYKILHKCFCTYAENIFIELSSDFWSWMTIIEWCALQCHFTLINSLGIPGPNSYHLKNIYFQKLKIKTIVSLMTEINYFQQHLNIPLLTSTYFSA